MVPLQELRIIAEAFSEIPLVRKESRTPLHAINVGASGDNLLEVPVDEGNMVEELDDLLTSAAGKGTRSEWSKVGLWLYRVIDPALLSVVHC